MFDIDRGKLLAELWNKEEIAALVELLSRKDCSLNQSRVHEDVEAAMLEACHRGY